MAAELTLTVSPVTGSADVAANTSRVRIDLSITTTLGTWSHDYTTHGYIKLDGAQIADLNGKWVDINTTTALYSGEHTVTHHVDGTKTVTVEAGFDMNTTYTGWSYATREVTLSTIPRASTLSVPNITLGVDNTLQIRAAADVFTHKLTYQLGSSSGTVCSGTSGGTVSWQPDISLCAQLPQSTSGQGTLTLCTYHGGSEIGRNTYAFNAYVPASVVPAVTALQLSPVNDNSTLRNWGVYVKGKTKMQFSVTAQGAYGSSATGGSFSCAGQSGERLSGTTGVLAVAGTFTPQATVRDSRQRTSAAFGGAAITVHDYDVPAISASYARRSNSSGAADDSGTHIAVQCAASCASVGGRNSLTLRVRTRPTGGSWSGYVQLQSGVQRVLSGFETTRSYEVELSAVDALGEGKAVVYTVPTESVAFMLQDGGAAASFGKYPEHGGLDMGWDIHMNGNRVTGLPTPTVDSEAAPWKYVGGRGLGDGCKWVASMDDVLDNGWYQADIPSWGYFAGIVTKYSHNACVQHMWSIDTANTKDVWEIQRHIIAGVPQPWEWVNPPLYAEVEYRTTERYKGSPVYVKVINFGAVPASGVKENPHGIAHPENILQIIGKAYIVGEEGNFFPLIIGGEVGAYAYANATNIVVKAVKDCSIYESIFIVKYTK